jgi:hypothetical protein
MLHTFKYKTGYIHISSYAHYEIIRVRVDAYAYLIEVKSIHSAKILITKHENKIKGTINESILRR